MKKQIYLVIAMLATSAMMSKGQSSSNDYSSEARTSKPYHFISIKGEMYVKIVQDVIPGVIVEGTNYQLGNTVTLLRNDTLFVYQTNVRKGDSKPRVMILVQDLVSLEVSGNSKVICAGIVNADYLTVKAKEGAQIKLDVRALKVESKVTGCGSIILEGTTAGAVEIKDGCGTIDSHLLDVTVQKGRSRLLCPGC